MISSIIGAKRDISDLVLTEELKSLIDGAVGVNKIQNVGKH